MGATAPWLKPASHGGVRFVGGPRRAQGRVSEQVWRWRHLSPPCGGLIRVAAHAVPRAYARGYRTVAPCGGLIGIYRRCFCHGVTTPVAMGVRPVRRLNPDSLTRLLTGCLPGVGRARLRECRSPAGAEDRGDATGTL